MPLFGPKPRQLNSEILLGQGIFGNPSNPSLVKGDTVFPDFNSQIFDAADILESFADGQSLDVAWSGRLGDGETRLVEVRLGILADDNGSTTNPPTYCIKIYAEGAVTNNPVFDSGILLAPTTFTEIIIAEGSIAEQPTGLKRYHVVLEAGINLDQNIQCTRPLVRQE